MADSEWWRYVQRIAAERDGKVAQKRIAAVVGTSEATVSRWSGGTSQPEPRHVVAFCRHYGRSPAEGLIAAGFLTAEEAGVPVTVAALGEADLWMLLAEVSARIAQLRQAAEAGTLNDEALQRSGFVRTATPLSDEADGPPPRLQRRSRTRTPSET